MGLENLVLLKFEEEPQDLDEVESAVSSLSEVIDSSDIEEFAPFVQDEPLEIYETPSASYTATVGEPPEEYKSFIYESVISETSDNSTSYTQSFEEEVQEGAKLGYEVAQSSQIGISTYLDDSQKEAVNTAKGMLSQVEWFLVCAGTQVLK